MPTLLKMKKGHHQRIPDIGFVGPGEEFECPDEMRFGETVSTPEDLVQAGIAERVEKKPPRRPVARREEQP